MPSNILAEPSGFAVGPPRRLGSEDGLSHNAVHALAQDEYGFLWIGTQDGLNRYDGHEFVTYHAAPDDPTALAADFVTALLHDPVDRLWVGTIAGLHRLRADGTFERLRLPHPRRDALQINSLASVEPGRVWVGTDAGLYLVEGGAGDGEAVAARLPATPKASVPRDIVVMAIRPAPDGTIWLLTEGGGRWLQRHDPAGRRLERFPVPGNVEDFLIAADGGLWVSPDGPVPPGSLRAGAGRPSGEAPEEIYRFFLRHRGAVWIGTLDGFLRVVAGETRRVRWGSGSRGLAEETLTALVGEDGDLWVGTYGGLLHWRFGARGFELLGGEEAGLTDVSSVEVAEEGSLWAGTFGRGLARLDPDGGRVVGRLSGGACSDYVWELATLEGALYVATSDGLCRVAGDALVGVRMPPDVGRKVHVLRAAGEELVLATDRWLLRYDPASAAVERVAAIQGVPSSLLVERDGTVWIGSELRDGGLMRVRGQAVRRWPGLAPSGIWDLHRDRRGTLWLATGRGLARLDETSGRLQRVAAPSASGSVHYSIVEDDGGRLWIGTSRGLLTYVPGSGGGGSFHVHSGRGRVGNAEFNRHGARRTADGRLLLAGMHGITRVRPEVVLDESALIPVLLRVRIAGEGRVRDLRPRRLERLVLEPADHTVTFEAGPVDPAGRVASRYEYRLDGLESEWFDGGGRPVARYTTIPPDEYTFRVRVAGQEGIVLALPVTVLPPFWATWWFRGLVAVAVVSLAAIAYRVRVRHLLEVQRMRLRIADDLHDELGSEVAGIGLMSGIVARRDGLPEEDRRRLAEIEAASSRVSDGLQDIVWYTKPEHDTVAALAARIREHAQRLLRDMEHEIDLPDAGELPVDMRVRRDLYLAFKELLHNALRHADASRVEVNLRVVGGDLELVVADDGRGFDPGAAAGGTGLVSLERRARQLGAELEIHSAPGRGTRARIRTPLEVAAGQEGGGGLVDG